MQYIYIFFDQIYIHLLLLELIDVFINMHKLLNLVILGNGCKDS